MEEVSCAICGGSGTEPLFTKWGLTIVKCQGCGLVFVNPRGFSIESDEYFRGPYLETIEQQGVLRSNIEYLYNRTLEHLETLLEPSRILDVGCAMGHFMVYARNRGWQVHGIECSAYAGAYGRERWGLPIQSVCDLRAANLPGHYFDACVLIEVIEHLPNPDEVLAEVCRLLKPGGVVYLTTPNFASYRALAERDSWSAVVPTGHLYYFTPDSLHQLLRKAGFSETVNLTDGADFEHELGLIPVEKRPAESELQRLRLNCDAEDQGKLVNGRAEGLVMCAMKAFGNAAALLAKRRRLRSSHTLDGRLVTTGGDSAEGRKVYLIHDGRKHWVMSTEWLNRRGISLTDTVQVDSATLRTMLTGPTLS